MSAIRSGLRQNECRAELQADGWSAFSCSQAEAGDLAKTVEEFALQLGEVAPGRGGQRVERILPLETGTAYAGSLSQQHGFAPLPLHTDTAHWAVPCRYLVIACADPGPKPTPTVVLDSRAIAFSTSEKATCRSAAFLIRNGRRSFYGSVTDDSRPFIRFDRGCMEPLSEDGSRLEVAFSLLRNAGKAHRHDWKRGDFLVIDNWRVLHGRGADQHTAPGRILLRAMVR